MNEPGAPLPGNARFLELWRAMTPAWRLVLVGTLAILVVCFLDTLLLHSGQTRGLQALGLLGVVFLIAGKRAEIWRRPVLGGIRLRPLGLALGAAFLALMLAEAFLLPRRGAQALGMLALLANLGLLVLVLRRRHAS